MFGASVENELSRLMLSASTSNTIDDPWTNMEPVRVGVVPPGRGTPDLFVTVERDGQPFLRIDVYAEYSTGPYCEAILWKTFAVIGWNDVVHFVEINSRRAHSLRCDGYFGSFRALDDSLLIADAARIHRIDDRGQQVWKSDEIGIDGVVIDRVEEGIILGEGEWDPPGGWKPFRLLLESGEPPAR
jgi:hypothetical protein